MQLRVDKTMTVDYLGVFQKDVVYDLTEDQIEFYERSRGVPFLEENLPEGVHLEGNREKSKPVNVDGFEDVPHKEV